MWLGFDLNVFIGIFIFFRLHVIQSCLFKSSVLHIFLSYYCVFNFILTFSEPHELNIPLIQLLKSSREGSCSTLILVYPISSPSILASKLVSKIFFLPNKRIFELETLHINSTQVLPCVEKF